MTWIQSHTGLAVSLRDPRPESINRLDIIVALARIPRFNGHTIEPFSVAQHSMLVLRIFDWLSPKAPAADRLAALLHDAHEAYMGDIPTPVVEALGLGGEAAVAQMKRRVQRAIHVAFGLPEVLPDSVKSLIVRADKIALSTEREWLMGPSSRPWDEDLPAPFLAAGMGLSDRYELARLFAPTLQTLAGEMGS